jgi:hypothetical protein
VCADGGRDLKPAPVAPGGDPGGNLGPINRNTPGNYGPTNGTSGRSLGAVERASGCELETGAGMLLLLQRDRPGLVVNPERNTSGLPVVRV